ncbi:MAG: hypothetical protein KatS3mg076_1834 [Candidatus Binatia bacterium]|nr:MAG: hypothetical protein KatS3mg076_1834 [Candidatus Binatia bacterium]
MTPFTESFAEEAALTWLESIGYVGGDGMPVEEFLPRPAQHWMKA